MKRTLRWLGGVYPERWRMRYQKEFEALIEQSTPKWQDLGDVLRGGLGMQMKQGRLVLWALAFGLAGATVAGAVVFFMRGGYQSEALVRLEVPYSTVSLAAEERKRELIDRVLTPANLLSAMKTSGIPAAATEAESIRRMREAIQIEKAYRDIDSPHRSTLAIRFEGPDRYIAQRVTQNFVNRVIEENFRAHVEGTPLQAELVRPASLPKARRGPSLWPNAGIAFAECLQIGLIVLLLIRRKRPLTYT